MLLQVKTYLAPDAHGGIGLFAGQDIPAGTVVMGVDPAYETFISIPDYFLLSPGPQKKDFERFGYPAYSTAYNPPLEGVMLDLDDSRYTNHSDDPTIGANAHEPSVFRALRDIKADEELTCDYRAFDPDFSFYKKGVHTCLDFLAVDQASGTSNALTSCAE